MDVPTRSRFDSDDGARASLHALPKHRRGEGLYLPMRASPGCTHLAVFEMWNWNLRKSRLSYAVTSETLISQLHLTGLRAEFRNQEGLMRRQAYECRCACRTVRSAGSKGGE